jgi:NhaP-type Na+/H+ or K+/H+ antiporter
VAVAFIAVGAALGGIQTALSRTSCGARAGVQVLWPSPLTDTLAETVAPFDANLFLTVLLPIIVFEAGFSTNRVRRHPHMWPGTEAVADCSAGPVASATFSETSGRFRCWRWWAR